MEGISDDVLIYKILPLLSIRELYELRSIYPNIFSEAISIELDTLEGTSNLLQLALNRRDSSLLNFVIDNLSFPTDHYLYSTEGRIDQAPLILDVMYYLAIDRYNQDLSQPVPGLIVAILSVGDTTTSEVFNSWVNDMGSDSISSRSVSALTSDEVIDNLNPSMYSIYGDVFGILYEWNFHIDRRDLLLVLEAIDRIRSNLGYIPQEIKDAALPTPSRKDQDVLADVDDYVPELEELVQSYLDEEGYIPDDIKDVVYDLMNTSKMADDEFMAYISRYKRSNSDRIGCDESGEGL